MKNWSRRLFTVIGCALICGVTASSATALEPVLTIAKPRTIGFAGGAERYGCGEGVCPGLCFPGPLEYGHHTYNAFTSVANLPCTTGSTRCAVYKIVIPPEAMTFQARKIWAAIESSFTFSAWRAAYRDYDSGTPRWRYYCDGTQANCLDDQWKNGAFYYMLEDSDITDWTYASGCWLDAPHLPVFRFEYQLWGQWFSLEIWL